jgi:hypothetical protein
MATFSIKATGIEAIQAKIAEPKFKAGVNAALNAFALSTVNDAKQLAPKDEGILARSINFDPATDYVATINVNVDYAAYVEFGTKKFAASYVSGLPRDWQSFAAEFKGKGNGSFADFVRRLTLWAKRTGKIPVEAAYVTALKILRNGLKPRPYLYPAFNKNLPQLTKDLNNAVQ